MGARIWLVVALSLGVGGGAIALLLYTLKATSNSYEETLQAVQESARDQDAARQIQVTFKKEVQEWKDVLLRGYNPADLMKYSDQFHAQAAAVNQMSTALRSSVTDAEAKRSTEDFVNAHAAMREKYEAALQAFARSHGENSREADRSVKGQDRAATDLLDATVNALVKRATAAVASQKEAVARKIWMTGTAVSAAFVVIVVLAAFTIRQITHSLREAVEQLNDTAGQMAAAASETASGSQSLAHSSSEQAASLEETSAASEEIHTMVRKNTENLRTVAALTAGSEQKFAETNQRLDAMVEAMDEINAESEKISKIIKVIDEIAFQTNILALNAAVEAARAGEAGLGFAVVADEVRSLAHRCAQAAKDTTALIEESIAKSSGGKTKVDQVAGSIRAITGESAKVKVLVDEVNLGSQEQGRGIEQIAHAITQMEQTTQTVAAAAEESAASAEELHAQAETLKNVVGALAAMVGAA